MAAPAVSIFRTRLSLSARNVIWEPTVCKACMHQTARPAHRSLRQTPFLQAFKAKNSARPRYQSSAPTSPTSPLNDLGKSIAGSGRVLSEVQAGSKGSSWPRTSSKAVAYWLLGSAASVFGIVVFGGLTRLTESGLSITEWRPVTGSFPPRDESAWEEEFALYKLSPEFKMLNSRMTLDEFKKIYWMEWTHRLWGRLVGISFLVPTAYFIIRRRVDKRMARRLVGICGLIGFQGIIGWWMVKSGLKDDLFEQGKHPRVSQYRLAAHLGTAFIAYLAMLWNGLRILQEHKLLGDTANAQKLLDTLSRPELRIIKRSVAALMILTFATAMSGALVAGLDAGLIYNDFPWMGQGLLPPKRELFDSFYSHTPDQRDLYWRNALENPVLVQLDHRILATSTFSAIIALALYSRFNSRVRAALPKAAKTGILGLVHMASLQVALGITTLWYLVPTPLAAAHQAGALALLSVITALSTRLWISKHSARLLHDVLRHAKKSHSGRVLTSSI